MNMKNSHWKLIELKKLVTVCRDCQVTTKLFTRSHLPKKKKLYMFTLCTICPQCGKKYLVSDSIVDLVEQPKKKKKKRENKHQDYLISETKDYPKF